MHRLLSSTLLLLGSAFATADRKNVLVYKRDDLAAGPFEGVILPSEVIGMHVFEDSNLFLEREDRFTFVNAQCVAGSSARGAASGGDVFTPNDDVPC